jgi:hypothetical protein
MPRKSTTRRRFDPSTARKGDRQRELLLDNAEQILQRIPADRLTLDDVAAGPVCLGRVSSTAHGR